MKLSVLSPYAPLRMAPSFTPPTAEAGPTDGFVSAPSTLSLPSAVDRALCGGNGQSPLSTWSPPDMRLATASEPETKRSGFTTALLVGIAAVGIFGVAAGTVHAAEPPQATVSATQSQQQAYSDPARPLPDSADVDTDTWVAKSKEAFKAYNAGDTERLLKHVSNDGVWVRGLQDAPLTDTGHVYMTKAELTKDLREKGDFYKQVFEKHANDRFVISPDAQGNVQTILLD